jgi:nucleoporin NDC1
VSPASCHEESCADVGVPGSLFNFLPVLLYTTVAFLGAVPVFVLRKQTLTSELSRPRPHSPYLTAFDTATFPTAASRFAQWTTLLQPVVVPVFLAYAVGYVPLFYAYLWCASSVSRYPRIGLTFYHEG